MLSPAQLMERLEGIEQDLADRQNAFGSAAEDWYRAKRDKEHAKAVAYLKAEGTVGERTAHADEQTALDGKEAEAEFEALKAVVRVLETRATIGMALLKTHGRT